MEAIKSVEQSYLTQLWSNDVFNKNKEDGFTTLTNKISKRFTIAVLSIAALLQQLTGYLSTPQKL